MRHIGHLSMPSVAKVAVIALIVAILPIQVTATHTSYNLAAPFSPALISVNDGMAKESNTKESNTKDTPIASNPHDPNAPTLAELYSPTDSELSYANTDLLAKNAELTRQVNDLTTQVNVLVQERSGQLFIYGAITAVLAMIVGFVVAKLTNRQRW